MKIWMKDGKFCDITDEQKSKLSVEELAAYTSDKNKSLIDDTIKEVNEKIDQIKTLNEKETKALKESFKTGIDAIGIDAFKATIETMKTGNADLAEVVKDLRETVKTQGLEIKKNKDFSIPDIRRKVSREGQLKQLIVHGLLSDEFKEFEGRGFKGASNKMYLDQDENGAVELKDTTSKTVVAVGADHTGTVMISEIADIVRDDTPTRRSHVRDIINVGMTDQAQIVAGQVYDWTDALTLGATMLAENGEAPESSFKSKEVTWGLKRIANSMRISKRYFKTNGLQWVIDHVLGKLPDATLYVEDFQLLFGDGAGNNVQGLANDAQAFDLTPNTYAALDFDTVATYNGGTQSLVTFVAAHNMGNGDNLTIANATHAGYNATHTAVEVVNTLQVIIDVAYVAEAAGLVDAWTGSSTSPFYHAIDNAQEYDVLAVADASLEAGEYSVSGHVIHPSQATQMGLLKDTQGNYLAISKDENGKVVGVNGKPIVQTTAMPYGKFISGDFTRNGLELKEYTPLNIQFVEDVETVRKNEIVVVIEEEIIFPIYNPYWFTFGKFSTAKTELETP